MTLSSIFSNKAITLPILSWFLAQFIKFILCLIKYKKLDFRKFVASGGMPSSHSAISVCLATVIGIQYGFGSGEFAISAILSFIVMADAAGVRRGRQTGRSTEQDHLPLQGNKNGSGAKGTARAYPDTSVGRSASGHSGRNRICIT